jgi:hypothetical protein
LAYLTPTGVTRRKPLGGTEFQDYAYRRLSKSAISNKVEMDMKVDEFPEALPKYCAILTSVLLDPKNSRSYVMKRINDRLPYRKDNLIFISRRAFGALMGGLTLFELKQVVQFLDENQPYDPGTI